ncbi:MAG: hypothetical protein ACRAVC_10125 [Trichormus sp.]
MRSLAGIDFCLIGFFDGSEKFEEFWLYLLSVGGMRCDLLKWTEG